MKILVTGHTGYIGSVLAARLQKAGHEVLGFDSGFYATCLLGNPPAEVTTINKDIRDVEESDLTGVQAVIHLAALSNDPLGELTPNLTEDINFKSTVKLAELSKKVGVERFVFASTSQICTSFQLKLTKQKIILQWLIPCCIQIPKFKRNSNCLQKRRDAKAL